eukprot:CAMPEP_0114329728 /NCGR_PEP_ID=MMETSP0101-20121206/1258_1 /TAXON_ID=38822 ORGANISM="Pteridomonas danica, Strain PT" /NCGR_SAMPLE_ID=MMETSP0101 /ASSEMBLY_ACC=CAM_ASM_000211 /LENGTH=361 /DNA_ID=CAMNT_0001459463 /DNA_START=113 /DNA_END=1198 /DNA_ORIENTATION=+
MFANELIVKGEKFGRDTWPLDLKSINRVDVNPGLMFYCESLLKFKNSIGKKGANLNDGVFAWHGTAEAAIQPICDNGFDPKRRSGQAYGPGEYFGINATTSASGYAKGSKRLILCYLLKTSDFSRHSDYCYVVNNPVDSSYSFCIPLMVFGYDTENTLPDFKQYKSIQHNFNDDDGGGILVPAMLQQACSTCEYITPYRWHWQADGMTMEPYNDHINSLLESFYDQYRSNRCSRSIMRTPFITRYLDDTPQEYDINFETSKQQNVQTKYQRHISRIQLKVPLLSNGKWCVKNDQNLWAFYDSLIQAEIETAYQNYSHGNAPSFKMITFPGRNETYEINFAKGIQTNSDSKTERMIKRVQHN